MVPDGRDYASTDGAEFRWNECEMMGLEAAEGNHEWQSEVRKFWDHHFPVMLAVHSDYDFLAIDLDDDSIVHGSAPEWEEVSPIAPSFSEFLRALELEAAAEEARWPLAVFLGAPG